MRLLFIYDSSDRAGFVLSKRERTSFFVEPHSRTHAGKARTLEHFHTIEQLSLAADANCLFFPRKNAGQGSNSSLPAASPRIILSSNFLPTTNNKETSSPFHPAKKFGVLYQVKGEKPRPVRRAAVRCGFYF